MTTAIWKNNRTGKIDFPSIFALGSVFLMAGFGFYTVGQSALNKPAKMARLALQAQQIEACETSGGYVMYVEADDEGGMRPVKRADSSVVCEAP